MKIYNLGSLNIDYVYSVDRFVTAGETVSSRKLEVFPGGKGLNQSVALARAGARVIHGAKVGADGDFLIDTLNASGVDTSRTERVKAPCGHAIIQVDKTGQNCILIHGGTNRMLEAGYIERFLSDAGKGDIILLQNETNCLPDIFAAAHEKRMRIAFNPSPVDDGVLSLPLEYVSYLFCNETEAEAIFGKSKPEDIMNAFISLYPDCALILTLGKQGAYYRDARKKLFQPIYLVSAVDTTGAGDTFTGYFLAALVGGGDEKYALNVAARAASIAVSRPGAASSIPYLREVTV